MEHGSALPELPAEVSPGDGLDRRPGGLAVDRHRERGLDLTPEELVARRSNRRWILFLAVPSIIVLLLALIATGIYWSNEPSGPKVAAPAGYKAVSDGYFGYVVPKSWATNPAFTDDAGDIDTSGPSGWAGEHRGYLFHRPVLGQIPPASLQAFGMPRPEPFQLSDGHPVAVKGADAAFAYTATRPGGFRATVVDAWSAHTGVELWLMVQAPASVTDRVVSSLQAG